MAFPPDPNDPMYMSPAGGTSTHVGPPMLAPPPTQVQAPVAPGEPHVTNPEKSNLERLLELLIMKLTDGGGGGGGGGADKKDQTPPRQVYGVSPGKFVMHGKPSYRAGPAPVGLLSNHSERYQAMYKNLVKKGIASGLTQEAAAEAARKKVTGMLSTDSAAFDAMLGGEPGGRDDRVTDATGQAAGPPNYGSPVPPPQTSLVGGFRTGGPGSMRDSAYGGSAAIGAADAQAQEYTSGQLFNSLYNSPGPLGDKARGLSPTSPGGSYTVGPLDILRDNMPQGGAYMPAPQPPDENQRLLQMLMQ